MLNTYTHGCTQDLPRQPRFSQFWSKKHAALLHHTRPGTWSGRSSPRHHTGSTSRSGPAIKLQISFRFLSDFFQKLPLLNLQLSPSRCQWQLCRCLLSRCRYLQQAHTVLRLKVKCNEFSGTCSVDAVVTRPRLSTLAPTTSSLPLVERRSACQQVTGKTGKTRKTETRQNMCLNSSLQYSAILCRRKS